VLVPEPEPSRLTTGEKVALFRRLFRGRADVYPVRWESKTTSKTGYSPACANEWLAGVCEKPRIKCGDCGKRLLIPLSDAVIYDHLAGEHTVVTMRVHSRSPAKNWGYRRYWKFLGQARVHTSGCFSPARFQPAMPVASAPRSSATPVPARGN
jgi:hypothetical protein